MEPTCLTTTEALRMKSCPHTTGHWPPREGGSPRYSIDSYQLSCDFPVPIRYT